MGSNPRTLLHAWWFSRPPLQPDLVILQNSPLHGIRTQVTAVKGGVLTPDQRDHIYKNVAMSGLWTTIAYRQKALNPPELTRPVKTWTKKVQSAI